MRAPVEDTQEENQTHKTTPIYGTLIMLVIGRRHLFLAVWPPPSEESPVEGRRIHFHKGDFSPSLC